MKRLLVVDDVHLFRAGLTAALIGAGYDVIGEAADGETAVAVAESEQPDIVLLDILMPGVSGIDVLGKIRAVSPSSEVVLLTGSESEEDLVAAIDSHRRPPDSCVPSSLYGRMHRGCVRDGDLPELRPIAGIERLQSFGRFIRWDFL